MQTRCTTCNVAFESVEAMRPHYATEMHLQNVRRRVEGKKPMTRGEFNMTIGGDEDDEDAPTFHCKLCKKIFRSVQTLQSHVKSTAHLMKKEERILARDSDAASMLTSTSLGSAAIGLHRRHRAHHKEAIRLKAENTSAPKVPAADREEDCGALRCLFCGHKSESVEDMLEHLSDVHNFNIPLLHRCTNVAGLLDYLGRKINGLMCIVCNEKTKRFESLEALRAHMLNAGHQYFEVGPEYQEFYEGALDDMTRNEEPKHGAEAQLVLSGNRTVFKRDTQGLFHRLRETTDQTEKRRAITAAHTEAQALIKKERYEAMAPAMKENQKLQKEQSRQHNKYMMQHGIKNNKLHPKGYDGEGEVN